MSRGGFPAHFQKPRVPARSPKERLFQPFLPFQTILPSWRWEIVNKGETYTPPPGLGSFEYVGNKIVRPATDQDQKSLPAYMIYQPKQLEDKIPTDLTKGGPSLKACSNAIPGALTGNRGEAPPPLLNTHRRGARLVEKTGALVAFTREGAVRPR